MFLRLKKSSQKQITRYFNVFGRTQKMGTLHEYFRRVGNSERIFI